MRERVEYEFTRWTRGDSDSKMGAARSKAQRLNIMKMIEIVLFFIRCTETVGGMVYINSRGVYKNLGKFGNDRGTRQKD